MSCYAVLAHLSVCYPPPRGRLPTCYSPVRHCTHRPKPTFSFDLHVLGTPPAFVLSQDQTLQFNWFEGGRPPYFSKEKTLVRHKLPSPLFSSQRPERKATSGFRCHNFLIIRMCDFIVKRKIAQSVFFFRPLPHPSRRVPRLPTAPSVSGRLACRYDRVFRHIFKDIF